MRERTVSEVFGREGWPIGPFYFRPPGGGLANSFAVPLHFTERECAYRLNTPLAVQILTRVEERRPGSLKKGLTWLAPFPEPPCWHQITGVKMQPDPLGIVVTLKLGEQSCKAHGSQ